MTDRKGLQNWTLSLCNEVVFSICLGAFSESIPIRTLALGAHHRLSSSPRHPLVAAPVTLVDFPGDFCHEYRYIPMLYYYLSITCKPIFTILANTFIYYQWYIPAR